MSVKHRKHNENKMYSGKLFILEKLLSEYPGWKDR